MILSKCLLSDLKWLLGAIKIDWLIDWLHHTLIDFCWLDWSRTHYRVGEPTAAWQFVDIVNIDCLTMVDSMSAVGNDSHPWVVPQLRNGCQLPWGRDGSLQIQSLVEFIISSGSLCPPHIGSAWQAHHNNNNKVQVNVTEVPYSTLITQCDQEKALWMLFQDKLADKSIREHEKRLPTTGAPLYTRTIIVFINSFIVIHQGASTYTIELLRL